MFIVFDLDGTMCDGSHKNHLLEYPGEDGVWPEQDFQPWIDACEFDQPIEPVVAIASAMVAAGHRVEFWTGRGENCREPTVRWLERYGFVGHELRMRQPGNPTTPDDVVKVMFLKHGTPDLIFEDKPSVVRMWRELGIPVAQMEPAYLRGYSGAGQAAATATENAKAKKEKAA